jgi:outer membrane immunogenic protein
MNKSVKVAALALGLSTLACAHAQQGPYMGVNLLQVTYKEDGIPTATPMAIGFKIGNRINSNLAVEARLGTGLSDDTVNVLGLPVKLEVDRFIGVYMRGIAPISEAVSVYGLVGYTDGELTASVGNFSVSTSDSDFSYGLGADFAVANNVSLNVEWGRMFKGPGYKLDALSFGVSVKF